MNPRFHDGSGYEQHSADGGTYLERDGKEWAIWFSGRRVPGTFKTREAARVAIRERKSSDHNAARRS